MNSGVKTGLILLLLGGVVFGVTVIASYTGGFQQVGSDDTISDGGDVVSGPPLEFALTEVGYSPSAEDQIIRAYFGFYEISPELQYQSFWFRQPHKKEVRVAVKGRSCTACTSARLGVLPSDPLREYVSQVKAGKVPPPFGPTEALSASLMAAAVTVNSQIKWQEFDFDHTDRIVAVPPAESNGPQVGVFQMVYKTQVIGPKTLDALISMAVADLAPVNLKLSVSYTGMPAFRVTPLDGKVILGELPEAASPRVVELFCWSATRRLSGTGRTLPPPAIALAPRDPFIQISQPVPVPDHELGQLAAGLAQDNVQPPVLSAYSVKLTAYRSRPAGSPADTPPEPEIGPFSRELAFVVPGEPQAQILTVSGTHTGLVALADAKLIDLESFPARTGKPEKGFTLMSDRPGLKLSVATDQCRPRYVAVKLGEPEESNGRRRWRLTVSVPADTALGELPADSAVVLLADTGDGSMRRVKLPLKGRAHAGR